MAETELNLRVLRRCDAAISRIVATSTHAAMYQLSDDHKWTKLSVEGALFCVERAAEPRWGFCILNQQSTENFFQLIHKGMTIEHKNPFLIYKSRDGSYYGIWIHSDEERTKIGEQLSRFANATEEATVSVLEQGVSYAKMTAPPKQSKVASPPIAKAQPDDDSPRKAERNTLAGLLRNAMPMPLVSDKAPESTDRGKKQTQASQTVAQPPPSSSSSSSGGDRLLGMLQGATKKAGSPRLGAPVVPTNDAGAHLSSLLNKAMGKFGESSPVMNQSNGSPRMAEEVPPQRNESSRLAGLLANAMRVPEPTLPEPSEEPDLHAPPVNMAPQPHAAPLLAKPPLLPPPGTPPTTKNINRLAHLLQKPGISPTVVNEKTALVSETTSITIPPELPARLDETTHERMIKTATHSQITPTLSQIVTHQHCRHDYSSPPVQKLTKAHVGKMITHMLNNDDAFLTAIHSQYSTLFDHSQR